MKQVPIFYQTAVIGRSNNIHLIIIMLRLQHYSIIFSRQNRFVSGRIL